MSKLESTRSSRLLICSFVTLVVVGVIAGGMTAGASTHSAKVVKGGVLTLTKATENANGWDPVKFLGVPTNTEVPQAFAIFDTLFYLDPTTQKLLPRLGTSMTTNDSGKTWTLKLRSGVKFSDGTVFDATAVKFNWDRILDPANQPLASNGSFPVASQIQTSEVVDPQTIKITLKAADPNFDEKTANKLGSIGSPTALKADAVGFKTKPVGAGPFILKEWVRDSKYTFEKNPTYWEQGRPYLDGMVINLVTDEAARLNNVQVGAADVNQTFDPDTASMARQNGLKTVSMATNAGGFHIGLNLQKPPFNDVRVRKAIDMAIDRAAFNKTRRGADKSALMNTIDSKGTTFYDPSLRVPKFDLPGAQKLIDQYVAENGNKPIEFSMMVFSTPYIQTDSNLIVAMLAKLNNVKITTEVLAPTTLVGRYSTGNFQAYTTTQARWNNPALDMTTFFLSTSPGNTSKYSNPTVDSALTQLLTATDLKTQRDLYKTAMTQILKDSATVWYTRQPSNSILSKRVGAYPTYFDQVPLLDSVWVKKSA